MRKVYWFFVVFLTLAARTGTGFAESFQMTDGQSMTGDVVTFNESGVVLRLADDKYSERIPWVKTRSSPRWWNLSSKLRSRKSPRNQSPR